MALPGTALSLDHDVFAERVGTLLPEVAAAVAKISAVLGQVRLVVER